MQSITIQGNETLINAILELVKCNPTAKIISQVERPKTYANITELKADYENRVNEVINDTVELTPFGQGWINL